MMAVKFLAGSEGQSFLGALKNGNVGIARTLLRGFGAENASQDDVEELFDIAREFETADDKVNNLRQTMIGSPEDYIIKTGAAIGDGLTGYLGQRAENNANALATALLEAGRMYTPQQEAVYGYHPLDKQRKATAAAILAKGQNKKAGYEAVNKVLNKVAGDYERDNQLYKTMQAAQILNGNGMPSSGYNFLNGMRSSADKNRGGM